MTFLAVDTARRAHRRRRGLPGGPAAGWKLRIDFGPEIGEKRSSAQITNYSREQLAGGSSSSGFVSNFPPRQIGAGASEVLVLGSVSDDHPVRADRVPARHRMS